MGGKWLPDQINFKGPIPEDVDLSGIRAKTTTFYDPMAAILRETLQPLNNNDALINILKNTDIDILLKTLGNAFFPRRVTVGVTPTEIIAPNRYPRGYILINPNTTVSGVVSTVTVFGAGTVFAVAATPSAAIDVSAHGGAAFIMNITEASAGPVTVDVQTLDPISGNWATAQSDIFAGAASVGTFYANVGGLGVDNMMRLLVTVATDTMTGSIAAILKPQLAGTVAGPAVFLGSPDVNTTIGFPLLGGQKETIYLRENTPIFGIAVAATDINIFELQ